MCAKSFTTCFLSRLGHNVTLTPHAAISPPLSSSLSFSSPYWLFALNMQIYSKLMVVRTVYVYHSQKVRVGRG